MTSVNGKNLIEIKNQKYISARLYSPSKKLIIVKNGTTYAKST